MGLTGLSRDALHVYAGMLVFLLAAVILRKSLRSPVPWILTVAVACGMEVVDAIDSTLSVGHFWLRGSAHDVINTTFWPTVLLLVCRYTRLVGPTTNQAGGQSTRG